MVSSLTTCPTDFHLASPHRSQSLEIPVCFLLFLFLWRTLTGTSGIYTKTINKMEPLRSPQRRLLNSLSSLSFCSPVPSLILSGSAAKRQYPLIHICNTCVCVCTELPPAVHKAALLCSIAPCPSSAGLPPSHPDPSGTEPASLSPLPPLGDPVCPGVEEEGKGNGGC